MQPLAFRNGIKKALFGSGNKVGIVEMMLAFQVEKGAAKGKEQAQPLAGTCNAGCQLVHLLCIATPQEVFFNV